MSERVIVCGGRDYTNVAYLFAVLDRLHARSPFALVISGGASGADSAAVAWAKERGVMYVIEPADWENEGRAAGPRRNQRMLDKFSPSHVVAFAGGRGTGDMVRRAAKAHVPVLRYDEHS